MDDKKKRLIVIVSVLVVFIGVTLAYVVGQISDGAIGNANVTADTTDNLQFSVDKDISLNPTQFNVTEGGGGLSDTAVGTATLLANSTNNTASFTYYVYFKINSNDYIYTTEDQKPEIVLTIIDPTGQPVTSVDGLTYVNAENADGTTVSGFDITTKSGLYNITSNYEITSSSSSNATEQDWTFTVTFINLDTNQTENGGKALSAEIIVQHDEYKHTLAEYITNLYTEDGVNGIYLHDGAGTYGSQEARDNSYRYTGANPNNYVCFGSDAASCPADNLYRIIGVFGDEVKLIKADFANSDLLGTDGDYYSSVYNKTDYANYKGNKETINRYYWNYSNGSSSTNDWSTSRLNTVNLNTNYLNALESEWTDKIATTSWKVGGNTWVNIVRQNAPTAYQNEIVNPAESTTYSAKIGLMYVSDYMYGAAPTYWTKVGYTSSIFPNEEGQYGEEYDYRAAINDNWMYMGVAEWTISHRSGNTKRAFYVLSAGYVDDFTVYTSYGVRPSFYLESSVVLESGNGTQENPYRVEI